MTSLPTRPRPEHNRVPRPLIFVAAGGASALAIGVPVDVIDTDLFVRMTPVRWWEYPVLVLTALLTAVWAASPRPSTRTGTPGGARVASSTVLSTLAIGCPVCNKLIVAALGTSGALGSWAPVQPFLGVVSLVLVSLAVLARRRACVGGCAVETDEPTAPITSQGPTR